jgi:plastocyanin
VIAMLRIWPLGLIVGALVLCEPAAAADVEVGDDFFSPSTVRIAPGDRVVWRWSGAALHNVKSTDGQSESFRSSLMTGPGATFAHTFTRAGRFTYLCEVHPANMRGAVEVGTPPFADTTRPRLSGLRLRVGRRSVTLRFRLSETARVRVSLAGSTRRRLTRRFGRGRRALTLRRLRRGRQRVTLTPLDLAGNRGASVRRRFAVG